MVTLYCMWSLVVPAHIPHKEAPQRALLPITKHLLTLITFLVDAYKTLVGQVTPVPPFYWLGYEALRVQAASPRNGGRFLCIQTPSLSSHSPLPFPHNRVGCQQGLGWSNRLPVAIAAHIQDAGSPQTPRRQDPRWIHPVSRTARVNGQVASSSQTLQVLDFI